MIRKQETCMGGRVITMLTAETPEEQAELDAMAERGEITGASFADQRKQMRKRASLPQVRPDDGS